MKDQSNCRSTRYLAWVVDRAVRWHRRLEAAGTPIRAALVAVADHTDPAAGARGEGTKCGPCCCSGSTIGHVAGVEIPVCGRSSNGRVESAARENSFIKEQMLDALALGSEPGATVEPIHRAVERPMRPTQVRRHQVRVVEIGQRRAQMGRTRIEHRLAERPGRRPCGSRCNTTGTGARRSSGALRRRRTAGRQSRAPPVAGQACGAVGATPPRGGHRPSAYRRGRAVGVRLTTRVTTGAPPSGTRHGGPGAARRRRGRGS